jgi:hypothetical protein
MSPTRSGMRTMKTLGRTAAATSFGRRRPRRAAVRIDDRRLGGDWAYSGGRQQPVNHRGLVSTRTDQAHTGRPWPRLDEYLYSLHALIVTVRPSPSRTGPQLEAT